MNGEYEKIIDMFFGPGMMSSAEWAMFPHLSILGRFLMSFEPEPESYLSFACDHLRGLQPYPPASLIVNRISDSVSRFSGSPAAEYILDHLNSTLSDFGYTRWSKDLHNFEFELGVSQSIRRSYVRFYAADSEYAYDILSETMLELNTSNEKWDVDRLSIKDKYSDVIRIGLSIPRYLKPDPSIPKVVFPKST